VFKSLDRLELTASNGNTVRFDVDPSGAVKVNARKGTHNQSVSVLSREDVETLVAWLSGTDSVEA
jgi:hypothetical protein